MEKCPTCELIKTGGMFVDCECTLHPKPKKKQFFKGFKHRFFRVR